MINFRLTLRYSQNDHLAQMPQLNRYWTHRDNLSDSRFFMDIQRKIHVNFMNHIFNNQHEAIKQLQAQDFDVFHPTYYQPYFLKYLKKRPYIVTIYDMIQETYPDNFDRRDPAPAWKKRLVEDATQIIAISDNTKKDIVKFLGMDPDRIQVIHLASSFNPEKDPPLPRLGGEKNIPEKYLLFCGNRFSYKNFTFMIKALSPVLKKEVNMHLVCAGGGKFTDSEKKLIREIGLVSRVHNFPADDATLVQLYNNAYAFIFPSLYEGFGIPVLEAFSCGCPALLSNTSSLPEVGGDAALYFDPVDGASLADSVERIIADESIRANLIARSRERAKLFSWEKTAAMTKKVYETALEHYH